ncbi:MAG: hypothetical protein V7704_14050 [Aurantimonas endophytica]|uniref:hypothetical protein n=1 Tax=Aurantimonas endophytica TaxID=1522175 RepID=UPI003002FEA2
MERLTLSTMKDLGRRLAIQTLISGTVMVGLNLAVQVDPSSLVLPWPLGGEMYVPEAPVAALEPGAARKPAIRHDEPQAAMASGKAERLTSPPKAPAATAVGPKDAEPARAAVDPAPHDVVLFDACMPRCESRDPLLAANRRMAQATPPAPAAALQLARYVDDAAQSAAVPREETGVIKAVSSRVTAVGQAGYRAVAGGLTSLTPW